MPTSTRSIALALLLAGAGVGSALFAGSPAVAQPEEQAPARPAKVLVNRNREGIAIQGYDPVAYFTLGKPVKGNPRFKATHDGAIYHFVSADHRARFIAEPAKYAPAFGGYCGYAASINKVSPVDPNYWQIIDVRLILQHNQRAFDLWNKDLSGNLARANGNWPSLVERNGTPLKLLVNTDKQGIAIEGHDPVAYFTEGRAVQGSPDYEAVYNGAIYRFTSMENRAAFEKEPARYAPAFGGYCGYAASINKVSPIDPTIFQIIEGRLVLQHTSEAYRLFNKDAGVNLERADRNWPGLVDRHGR